MTRQELMLNESVNLNFKYSNKLYKLKINVNDGLISLEQVISDQDTELLKLIEIDQCLPCVKEQEMVKLESKQEEKE